MVFHPGKKIVLVIATLRGGGAERVMTMLAGEWVRRGNKVTLITLGDSSDDAYEVPPGVNRIALNVLGVSGSKLGAITNNFRRWSRLRSAIRQEKPDAVISFMDVTNVLTLMATPGLKVPVIVSERIDPRYYQIPRGWARLRRHLYPSAGAVVVQTQSVAEWATAFIHESRVHVIPNPVNSPLPQIAQDVMIPDWLPAGPFIVAMGRLWKQKGFDLLLEAYAGLVSENKAAPQLVILGEGPERQDLEARVRDLGLSEKVVLPGRQPDPQPILRRAMFFVFSSRYEGFPNALLEAMAVGLPVISYDCPSGPADIINDGENGLLVPAENAPALQKAMGRLLVDEQLRERLGSAAASVQTRFSLDAITDQWESVISRAAVLK